MRLDGPFALPDDDLETIAPALRRLAGQRLLITGGTGFVGKWLLASLLHANRHHGAGLHATVLSRDPGRFLRQFPALADEPALAWCQGDVRDFTPPAGLALDACIHAATDVASAPDAQAVFDTCVTGTRRVIDIATQAGARRLLLLSSGAVYGPSQGGERLSEGHRGGPDPLNPASAYAEGKRAAEQLTALAQAAGRLHTSVARCFAFVGPYLPLDKQFAVGNFLSAARDGQPIAIQGDGTPLRSYLYAGDLARWLWILLAQAPGGSACNLGGDEAVSIRDLAERVVAATGRHVPVTVARAPGAGPVSSYLPDLTRARQLGLQGERPLDEALRRTWAWLQHTGGLA